MIKKLDFSGFAGSWFFLQINDLPELPPDFFDQLTKMGISLLMAIVARLVHNWMNRLFKKPPTIKDELETEL